MLIYWRVSSYYIILYPLYIYYIYPSYCGWASEILQQLKGAKNPAMIEIGFQHVSTIVYGGAKV